MLCGASWPAWGVPAGEREEEDSSKCNPCQTESWPDLGNHHLPPPPQSNHCPFLLEVFSTSHGVISIFSCCSSRQAPPGDLKTDFRGVPLQGFSRGSTVRSAQASQGYPASFISHKLLALAFLVSSNAFLKVDKVQL